MSATVLAGLIKGCASWLAGSCAAPEVHGGLRCEWRRQQLTRNGHRALGLWYPGGATGVCLTFTTISKPALELRGSVLTHKET